MNLASVLRPGGRLLLQFPNYPPSLSPGMTHFRTRAGLGRLMATAGFTQWSIGSLKLRRHARFLYEYLHERPIRAYRRYRSRNDLLRPLIYDESWAFQHGSRLEPFKYALHTTWLALSVTMRLGGPVFTRGENDLFMSQRLNGIQTSSFDRGEHSEHQSDARGETERQRDRQWGDDHALDLCFLREERRDRGRQTQPLHRGPRQNGLVEHRSRADGGGL